MLTPEVLEKAMQALARFSPLLEGAIDFDGVPPMSVYDPLIKAVGYINQASTASKQYETWQPKDPPPPKKRGT